MLVYIIIGLCLAYVEVKSDPKVLTNYGSIEGTTQTLFNAEHVDAFLGIPYAAPPIGMNRFAPPKQPVAWNETLMAKKLPVSCHQAAHEEVKRAIWFISLSEESEDCLYLNVWRPKRQSQGKRAVMIWLPGGGYYSGSSNLPAYDGSILASEQNVIVVTINYRLSVFGFFYANTTEVHGNAALQDQIAAIKWVKENIEAFGGDPNKITVFGESVGSISVSLLLTNKDTFNLFQNAIMESGSLGMPRLTLSTEDILSHSQTIARNVGCPIENPDTMIACMRAKPALSILNQTLDIPSYLKFKFVPVRNGIEVPFDVIKAAENVPPNKRRNLLGGTIPNEFASFSPTFFPDIPFNEDFTVNEKDWKTLLINNYQLRDDRLQDVLTHEYTNFTGINNRSQLRIEATNTVTDRFMICPQIDFMKNWITDTNKVFYYSFTHRPSKYLRTPYPEWIGPTHGDEVGFVFGLPLNPENGFTLAEKAMSEEIMTLFANFAKTGDPNVHNGINMNRWTALDRKQNPALLEIGEKTMKTTFMRERQCAFWREVYPNLISIQKQLDD